jgi:hypothetical protein
MHGVLHDHSETKIAIHNTQTNVLGGQLSRGNCPDTVHPINLISNQKYCTCKDVKIKDNSCTQFGRDLHIEEDSTYGSSF